MLYYAKNISSLRPKYSFPSYCKCYYWQFIGVPVENHPLPNGAASPKFTSCLCVWICQWLGDIVHMRAQNPSPQFWTILSSHVSSMATPVASAEVPVVTISPLSWFLDHSASFTLVQVTSQEHPSVGPLHADHHLRGCFPRNCGTSPGQSTLSKDS